MLAKFEDSTTSIRVGFHVKLHRTVRHNKVDCLVILTNSAALHERSHSMRDTRPSEQVNDRMASCTVSYWAPNITAIAYTHSPAFATVPNINPISPENQKRCVELNQSEDDSDMR
jgi:hypothetical protein